GHPCESPWPHWRGTHPSPRAPHRCDPTRYAGTFRRWRACTSSEQSVACSCRSSLQVCGQAMSAALTAVSGFLVAAERAGRIEADERVRPDDAGAQLVRYREDARALGRADTGGQTVRRVVRLRDRLRRGAEGQHGQHGAEDLVTRDAMGCFDAGEDRRSEPEALVGNDAVRRPALCTLGLADVAEFTDASQL